MWLSPIGCAMCSVHLRIPIQSQLGQRPAFVQHIAGLAVVEALTSEIGYEVKLQNRGVSAPVILFPSLHTGNVKFEAVSSLAGSFTL